MSTLRTTKSSGFVTVRSTSNGLLTGGVALTIVLELLLLATRNLLNGAWPAAAATDADTPSGATRLTGTL